MTDPIIDFGKYGTRVRLQSNPGNGANDIVLDFNPERLSNTSSPSDSLITVVMNAGQNQDAGVAANVGMFLCSPSQQFGFVPTGNMPQDKLGTFLSFDGSTGLNWGTLTGFVTASPIVVPMGYFLRFCTFQGVGFAAAGSRFRIDLSYYTIRCDKT